MYCGAPEVFPRLFNVVTYGIYSRIPYPYHDLVARHCAAATYVNTPEDAVHALSLTAAAQRADIGMCQWLRRCVDVRTTRSSVDRRCASRAW